MKCWICCDVGFIEHFQKFKINNKITEYKITLHCSCERGHEQKIDYIDAKGKRIFTEPISKYVDIFKLQKFNKERFGNE